jgi:hypothetical protein
MKTTVVLADDRLPLREAAFGISKSRFDVVRAEPEHTRWSFQSFRLNLPRVVNSARTLITGGPIGGKQLIA